MFQNYFFYERLELWDWQLDGRIFFMPRFVRNLSENGKEILSMKVSGLVWWDWQLDGRIFFMPRFVRNLSENGKEILSMKVGEYIWLGLVWWDWQRKDRSSSCHATSGICQRKARR